VLGVRRCLPVVDGSFVYLDPAAHVAWPDFVTLFTSAERLRVVYLDQQGQLTVEEAGRLVADGLAMAVGGRLFEQPALVEAVFAWDASDEIDFIADALGPPDAAGRGIEYGVGTGRIFTALLRRGYALDGLDASEPSLRWLQTRLDDEGPSDSMLVLGDLSECAFPERYDFAVAGLNTLRYLPSLAALRRHLHMAALSVKPGGRYVALIDARMDAEVPVDDGSAGEWSAGTGDEPLHVTWTKVRSDLVSRIDLERVTVQRGDGSSVIDEHQVQLSLAVAEWIEIFEGAGEWRAVSTHLEGWPSPVPLDQVAPDGTGNFWFVLERTTETGPPLFTR
jgi:hypothetical protein